MTLASSTLRLLAFGAAAALTAAPLTEASAATYHQRPRTASMAMSASAYRHGHVVRHYAYRHGHG